MEKSEFQIDEGEIIFSDLYYDGLMMGSTFVIEFPKGYVIWKPKVYNA